MLLISIAITYATLINMWRASLGTAGYIIDDLRSSNQGRIAKTTKCRDRERDKPLLLLSLSLSLSLFFFPLQR